MKIIVLTSNGYVHCLPAFAYLFNRFWGTDQSVMVMGYEATPPRPLPRNFSFHSIGRQADYEFSAGLLRMLDLISDPIFCLFLEDYFIAQPVNRAMVRTLFSLMITDKTISKIDLTDDRLKVPYTPVSVPKGLSLIQSVDDAPYQMSLQAAIWRADMLRQFVKGDENPWQFEKLGMKRVIDARRKGHFSGRVLGCSIPPITYINAIGGEGSTPGTYAKKRFPAWMVSALNSNQLTTGL